MLLALDLSTTATGTALFDEDGVLFQTSQIVPPSKFSADQSIHFIVKELKNLYPQVKKVVIEDTYCMPQRMQAFKVLNRLAGAVIFTCVDFFSESPTFYTATNARKVVGLASDIAKVQTQLYILEKFYPHIIIDHFSEKIESLRKQYVKRKLTKSQWDYQLTKLSKEVADQTKISNDIADAVVVGLAYLIKNKIIERLK